MAMRMPVEAIARELQQLDEREREKLDALRAKVEDLLYPSVRKWGLFCFCHLSSLCVSLSMYVCLPYHFSLLFHVSLLMFIFSFFCLMFLSLLSLSLFLLISIIFNPSVLPSLSLRFLLSCLSCECLLVFCPIVSTLCYPLFLSSVSTFCLSSVFSSIALSLFLLCLPLSHRSQAVVQNPLTSLSLSLIRAIMTSNPCMTT